MFRAKALAGLICLFILFVHEESAARGQYLSQWEEIYNGSTSSETGCQLCHQEPGGGNGWNQYGWAIRPLFLANRASNGGDDQAALALALEDVENSFNPDAAVDYEFNFLDEIRYNAQPGWVASEANTINFRDAAPLGSQPAPELFPNSETAIDLDLTEVAAPANQPLQIEPTLIDFHLLASGFNAPVKAITAPGIKGSIFVVEQRGKVIRVDLETGEKSTFLDIASQLVEPRQSFDERGLLSLAFHPGFATNGRFYTYQSEPIRGSQDNQVDFTTLPGNVAPDHRSMIVEYRASNPSCNSTVFKTKTLLTIDQPQFNHNAGDLIFGPDGYLYISLGDGGGADDQAPNNNPKAPENGHGLLGNGRDKESILGTILRIDPSGNSSANGKYSVPADNPFVGLEGHDEIFAFGFRNPYRMSFDPLCFEDGSSCTTLIAADVGQNKLEEINNVVSGGNYGWNWKEGSLFFIDPEDRAPFVTDNTPPGVPTNLVDPIAEYGRQIGISITGGYVYRGSNIPGLDGRYIFADFFRPSSNRSVMSLFDGVLREFSSDFDGNVSGFGLDSDKELYITATPSFGNPLDTQGTLSKILPMGGSYTAPESDDESPICPPSEDLCIPIKASNGKIAQVCL